MRKHVLACTAAMAICLAAPAALAQEAAAPQGADTAADDIIVTGSTRAERRFDVSYAINSVSQDEIQRIAPLNTADLAALDINDNVRFSDLTGTEGCDPVITGRDFVIATVAAPTKLPEAAAEPGAGAPTAAAAPAKGGGKTTAPAAKAPVKAAPKPAAKK